MTLGTRPSDTPVKWRYYGNRSGGWYLGMEDSAVIWRGESAPDSAGFDDMLSR